MENRPSIIFSGLATRIMSTDPSQSHNPFLASLPTPQLPQKGNSSAIDDLLGLDLGSPQPVELSSPTQAPFPTKQPAMTPFVDTNVPHGPSTLTSSPATMHQSRNPFLATPSAEPTTTCAPPAAEPGAPVLGAPITSSSAGVAEPLNYLTTTATPSATMPPIVSDRTAGQSTTAATHAQEQIDADARLAQSLAAADIHNDTQWSVKDIVWRGRDAKIIMQNENGPCSLIALTNVLLLQNRVQITPPDRPAVSYAYVSDMLADYLLEINADPTQLSRVLSVLPKLMQGFQVDVFFDQPTHFGSATGADTSAELLLFRLAQVPLLHGWLPDPSDASLYRTMQYVRSYNGATAALANEEAQSLRDSSTREVREFLHAYPTQLTPWGLHAVSNAIPPGELAVLFRNSHLSVVYRRREDEGISSMPALYMLVTDAAFQMDDRTVWESLEDTNGHQTRFFDAQFEQLSRSERAWGVTPNGVGSGTTADYALAVRLQREERERARAVQRARQNHRELYHGSSHAESDPDGASTQRRFSKVLPKILRKGFKK